MQTVIGLFENATDAQRAVQVLFSNGFTSDNVDVSLNDASSQRDPTNSGYSTDVTTDDRLAGSPATNISDDDTRISRDYSGDSVRNVNTSDSGNYNDRRKDDGDGDSFGDKVSSFFKNLFGSDDDDNTDRYVHVANAAGSIVTVHAQSEDEAERAADILDDYGAIDVDEKASAYGYSGKGNTFSGSDDYSEKRDSSDIENDTLNVIREDVNITKKEVASGGVRLRSRIIERPVEEKLRLKEDRIRVERNTVDRPATTADIQNFREGEIELTEYAEVPEIRKEARVVEEVKLTRDVEERTEMVNTTAMDTEVEVENLSEDAMRKREKATGL